MACRQMAALLTVGGRVPLSLRPVVGIAGRMRLGGRAWRGGSSWGTGLRQPPRACGRLEHGRMLGWGLRMKANYAIKPTPEQALGTNRTQPPARLIAALGLLPVGCRGLLS